MAQPSILAVILAAGEGTRMRSALPKVLHSIGNQPLLIHAIRSVQDAGASRLAVVVGHGAEKVGAAAQAAAPEARIFTQSERKGTAHAVLAARQAISEVPDVLLVTFGDTPLMTGNTLRRATTAISDGASVAVLGFQTDRPTGYGRLIERNGQLLAIREERDCTDEERLIQYCNGGVLAIEGRKALALLDRIENKNAKEEFYLTDLIALSHQDGLKTVAVRCAFEDVLGINNQRGGGLRHRPVCASASRRRSEG